MGSVPRDPEIPPFTPPPPRQAPDSLSRPCPTRGLAGPPFGPPPLQLDNVSGTVTRPPPPREEGECCPTLLSPRPSRDHPLPGETHLTSPRRPPVPPRRGPQAPISYSGADLGAPTSLPFLTCLFRLNIFTVLDLRHILHSLSLLGPRRISRPQFKVFGLLLHPALRQCPSSLTFSGTVSGGSGLEVSVRHGARPVWVSRRPLDPCVAGGPRAGQGPTR